MQEWTLGIIGCGNMASAIVANAINKQVLTGKQLLVYDRFEQQGEVFNRSFGAAIAATASDVVAGSNAILFAVKPQDAPAVFQEVGAAFAPTRKTAISIIAGLTLTTIETWLGKTTPVIRVMPNTPIQVGEGASAYAPNVSCNPNEIAQAMRIFAAGGITVPLAESHFDAVTALSGSGPAYVFYFIEALLDAAKSLGLPAEFQKPLVLQTLRGGLALAESSPLAPEILRKQVTSTGGTTEAALQVLEAAGFKKNLTQALEAARARSHELSQPVLDKR